MRFDQIRRPTVLTLALGLALSLIASLPTAALADARANAAPVVAEAPAEAAPPQAPEAAPAPAAPAPESTMPEGDEKAAPGVPSDAAVETVDVPARPVAFLASDAEWSEGFKAIVTAIGKVEDAVKTAGLKQAGPPFAVFLSTDDTNFHFEAMVPLTEKQEGKSDLTEGVKLGQSPSGKAIKFLHRGSYDDIDSTYDLITAYLDEKSLDAKNLFIEEYLTDTKDSDDSSLEADIYVFLK